MFIRILENFFMFKNRIYLIGLILTFFTSPAFCAIGVTVDTQDNTSLPMYTLKHGNVINITRKNKADLKEQIDIIANSGFHMITMSYDLIEDNYNKGNDWVGNSRIWAGIKDSPSLVNNGVDPVVQELREYADSKGLQVIMQINGAPYYGETSNSLIFNDPSNHNDVTGLDFSDQSFFSIDRSRRWSGGGNWYPLPIYLNGRLHLGEKIGQMIMAYESHNGAPDNAIWVGQQEPHHTIGFPPGPNGQYTAGDYYGVMSKEEKDQNIDLYLDVFGQITNSIWPSVNIGGIQELDGKHDEALSKLYLRGIKVDYFTVQDYQAGTRLSRTPTNELEEILTGMSSSEYGNHFENTKVLWHRFSFYKYKDDGSLSTPSERVNTTASMIRYLKALKVLVENSHAVHGYSLDFSTNHFQTNNPTILKQVSEWLASIGNGGQHNRVRPLVTNNPDLKGFAISRANKAWIIMWNEGTTNRQAKVDLKAGDNFDGSTCKQFKGKADNSINPNINLTYKNEENRLYFWIPPKGFSLVEVDATP